MARSSEELSCCAMLDIADINAHLTPKDVILSLHDQDGLRHDGGMYVFSDIVRHSTSRKSRRNIMGDRLKRFITRQRWGHVTVIPNHLNINSGNIVRVYIWRTTNAQRRRMYEWADKNMKNNEDSNLDWSEYV